MTVDDDVATCDICEEDKPLDQMKPAEWLGADQCCPTCFDPLSYMYEGDQEPWALLWCETDQRLFTQHEVEYTDSWICPTCGDFIPPAYEVDGLKERIQYDDRGQPRFEKEDPSHLLLKPLISASSPNES